MQSNWTWTYLWIHSMQSCAWWKGWSMLLHWVWSILRCSSWRATRTCRVVASACSNGTFLLLDLVRLLLLLRWQLEPAAAGSWGSGALRILGWVWVKLELRLCSLALVAMSLCRCWSYHYGKDFHRGCLPRGSHRLQSSRSSLSVDHHRESLIVLVQVIQQRQPLGRHQDQPRHSWARHHFHPETLASLHAVAFDSHFLPFILQLIANKR